MKISFFASLKQSTPSAKPLKFGPEGEAEIIFEADASQKEEIKKLIGQYGKIFKITLTEEENIKKELEPYAL